MGWEIEPDGLRQLLLRMHAEYRGSRSSSPRTARRGTTPSAPTARSTIPSGSTYLRGHLAAAHAAIEEGVDLRGLPRMVAARQLRVVVRIRQALRHRPGRLRHAAAHTEVERQGLRRHRPPTTPSDLPRHRGLCHRNRRTIARCGDTNTSKTGSASGLLYQMVDGVVDMISVIAESLTGRRIAITGATGFVGTALVERLIRARARLRAGPA